MKHHKPCHNTAGSARPHHVLILVDHHVHHALPIAMREHRCLPEQTVAVNDTCSMRGSLREQRSALGVPT
jgi:hypothetical protein